MAEHRWKHTLSASQRGYGAPWRKRRAVVLMRDHHLCQACAVHGRTTAANQVDHIVPKHKGGTDDLDNLRAICEECHTAKTIEEAIEAGGGRRVLPELDEDGWPVGQ